MPNEDIPEDAAQDALSFVSQDGRNILIAGRAQIGAAGAAGVIRGEWFGYKIDGTQVHYRKIETKLQYLNAGTWTDILTGLTTGTEASFANYSSLAGAFTFFVTTDGYWKINNAFPANPLQMYDATKNFHGRIIIDKGRTLLYRRQDTGSKDFTGLYGSKIDPQNATVYTTVSGEATISLGGTLAFVATGRNCFGVTITLTGTGEVFTDNFLGVLTGSLGGTGTINYITGVYTLSNAGVGTAGYQWENSNVKGLTDFTHSATRVAGEGFVLPQDQGGDAIQMVLIGSDGAYYSLKQSSTYKFTMDDTDLLPTNEVFYINMGVPSLNAGLSTKFGIVFLNTANPTKPEFTILEKDVTGTNLIPKILFSEFKFSNYNFSDCYFGVYERFIVISCRQTGSTANDRILLCSLQGGTVNVAAYPIRMFANDTSGSLFGGSSLSQTSYQLFTGFDDDGLAIDSYWISKADKYGSLQTRSLTWRFIQELLKKFRKFRVQGQIDPNQVVEVWHNYDDAGWEQIGTIRGDASYVDATAPSTIGSNFLGGTTIGGSDSAATIYPYFAEFKMVKQPKFRKRSFKLVPTGIGYFDFNFTADIDLMLFEARLPKRLRQKQNVSLSGTLTNQ